MKAIAHNEGGAHVDPTISELYRAVAIEMGYGAAIDEATGEVIYWSAEMGSPTSLMRRGWTRNSMKVGDVVTVEGSRAKDGSALMNARSIVLTTSGRRLFAGSSQDQGPE